MINFSKKIDLEYNGKIYHYSSVNKAINKIFEIFNGKFSKPFIYYMINSGKLNINEWIEEYVDEKINTALLNIPKDTEQHSNYSDGEWKVYRIKEIGKRLNDLGLTDKWQNYTYLYPEVYLTKEAAENHKPSDLHCDTAHATYEIIEQTVINK